MYPAGQLGRFGYSQVILLVKILHQDKYLGGIHSLEAKEIDKCQLISLLYFKRGSI